MATLETLRNKAGVFVAIIIGLALLAFILGDLFSSGQSILMGDQMTVGKVNGVALEYPQFQAMFEQEQQRQQQRMGSNSNSDLMAVRLREQLWQEFVRNEVMANECEALGIEVTDLEMVDLVTGPEPHPFVRQLFTNPETQEFMREQLQNFLVAFNEGQGLSAVQRDYWIMVERQIAESALQEKFNALVAKGLGVTKVEAEYLAGLDANSVNADYMVLPYSEVPDSTVTVSEAEVKDYYNTHREQYRSPERRDLAYVVFDVRPSEEDTQAAFTTLQDELPAFTATLTPEQFVSQNGDTPYIPKWEKREQLSAQVAEWAFVTAQEGEVSAIYREGDKFNAARLLGRKSMPDSAHARHILFSAQKYGMEQAHKMADSVAALLRGGADLAALAEQYSDDPGSKSKGGDLDWFAQGVMVKPFNEACFTGKVKDIQVVDTDFGAHVIEVLGHRGNSEYVSLAVLSQSITPGNHTYQEVFNQASAFAANSNIPAPNWFASMFGAGDDRLSKVEVIYDSLARQDQLSKRLANGLEPNQPQINGLASSREVIRWAFQAEVGDVSAVFEMGESYVVALLTKVLPSDGDFSDLSSVRSEVERAVRLEHKQKLLVAKVAEQQKMHGELALLAAEMGTGVKHADNVVFSGYAFGQEGFEPAAVGVTSGLSYGENSKPIAGAAGVFVAKAQAVNQTKTELKTFLNSKQQALRGRAGYDAFNALRRMADIEDYRAKFF